MTLPTLDTQNGSRSRTGAFDFESAPAFLLNAGRAITLGAICLAPWWFGCVRASEQVYLYSALLVAAAIAFVVVVVRAIRSPNSGSLRIPLLLIPMIAGIGLGAIQLMPGKPELTGSRVEQSQELAQWDLGEPLTSSKYTFYPHNTMLEIARYSFATLAFLIGYSLFRSPESQRFLWATVSVNGLVLVAFGLIQKFSWNGKLFWNVVLSNGGDPFASFVNRNNAASFVCIAIACALGLLVWAVDRRPVRATQSWLTGLAARIAAIDSLQFAVLITVALLGGGIIASASRSGALSFGIGVLVVLSFLAVRRRSVWPFVLAVCGIVVGATIVLSLEVQDRLVERVAAVDVENLDQRTRVRHCRDALNVTQKLPLIGAGLGTHRYAHLPYVSEFGRLWAVNADNQYVEVAVEAGLVGIGLLALFLLFAVRLFWVGRVNSIESSGTAVVVLFLICSQTVHGMFDFGIILPATLVTACLVLGTAAASIAARTGGKGASVWGGRLALPAVMLALSVTSVIGIDVCRAEAVSRKALSATRDLKSLTDAEVDRFIDDFTPMSGAEVCRQRARLLMERYERQTRAEVLSAAPDLTSEQIDAIASIESLHVTVQRLLRRGRSQDVSAARASEQVTGNLVPALESLHEAARRCPILPDTFATISRIESILDDNADDKYARRAVLLEPFDDRVTTTQGIDLMESVPRRAMGASFVRHGLGTVRWRSQTDALIELDTRFGLDKVLDEISPRDGFAAARLASAAAKGAYRKYSAPILRIGLASEQGQLSLESLLAQAEIHHRLGSREEAFSLFRKAASDYPGSAEAHFRYAKALSDSGDFAAALVEARVAIGLDPEGPGYSKLLNDLTARAIGEVGMSRSADSQTETS